MSHDSHALAVAIGESDLGKVRNKTLTWAELAQRLGSPSRDEVHTLPEYLALPKDRQDRLKNVGFFVGGHCADGKRKAAAISGRSVVCLDIDAATPEQIQHLLGGTSGLAGYEWLAHTTRKHREDAPRWRLVLPLDRVVTADRYGPLARILASRLCPSQSESMDAVDDVSFRVAQVMYWPSVCRNAEFRVVRNSGKLVDGEAVLAEWGDWSDWSLLPYSDKRSRKRPGDPARKAENPTTKRGIVGAFCRAYDVPAAIDRFLPDVYVPGDANSVKPRYTYLAGSTTNGAIIEDDGLFLYSHHGTDPCSERLVNAFDLVRVHLFGSEDEGASEDTPPAKLPSFKAMAEMLEADMEVVRELQSENYDIEAMFEDLGDADDDDLIGTVKPDADWFRDLDITENGQIKSHLANIALILQRDPRFVGLAAQNRFTDSLTARRSLVTRTAIFPDIRVRDQESGDPWTSQHDIAIRAILESPAGKGKVGYGLRVTDRDLQGAIDLAASNNPFHPVQDYLTGLRWDGTRRVETLLIDYLGCPDTAYHRQVATKFLVAAVTRIFEPGHKFDHALVLEGAQGIGKSSVARILGRQKWFSELHGDLGDRKLQVEGMLGRWILELPELAGLRKSEVDDTKAFLSDSQDTVRLAYERRSKTYHRQQVFIGTTNEYAYLKDATGNRRFWPVRITVKRIDIQRLEREIDQIWAEATATYRQWREAQPVGALPLNLDGRALEEASSEQDERRLESIEEATAGMVEAWLNRPVPESLLRDGDEFDDGGRMVLRTRACLREIWEGIGNDPRHYRGVEAHMMGRAMSRIKGWTKRNPRPHGKYGVQWCYERDSAPRSHHGYAYVVEEEDLLG